MPDRGRIKKNLLDLFNKWAAPQILNYEEPDRVGVPRGEPVGFSAKKFHAALAQVLKPAFTLAEIAKLVGVSAGQVRVWRTDDDFRGVAEELQGGFFKYISDRLYNHIKYNEDAEGFKAMVICLSIFPDGPLTHLETLRKSLKIADEKINSDHNDYEAICDYREIIIQFGLFFNLMFSIKGLQDKKNEIMLKAFPFLEQVLNYFITLLRNHEVDEEIKDIASDIIRILALICFV